METNQTNPESQTQVSEQTNSQSSEVVDQSTQNAQSAAPESQDLAGKIQDLATQPQTPAAPAYTPSFKYKVLAKEKDFPEHLKGVVKDADTEKQIREMLEKAEGLEHVSQSRGKLQKEYESFRAQAEPTLQLANQYNHFRAKGDLDSCFDVLGLSEEEVMKWAIKKAELRELPPEQRQVYDHNREAERRAWQLEQQLQAQQEQFQTFKVQQRSSELESVMSSPDISSIVESFDSRNGEGAFLEEVIARGQQIFYTRGVDASPRQVVQEILHKYGLNSQSAQASAQQMQNPNQGSPQKGPRVIPTIPNTGAGASSPAQRSIRSLEDLEKIANEKFGS